MKNILTYYFLFWASVSLLGQKCMEHKEFHNQELSDRLEVFTKEFKKQPLTANSRSKVEIQVVVHVVWHTEEENISEEQIHSQIAVLNQDFQLLNTDTSLVPASFKTSIGNPGFIFKLATVDEVGDTTNGITRTETDIENIGAPVDPPLIYYTDAGGRNAWDTKRYLNIWVCDVPDFFFGYGSRPGERIDAEDGIIVDYRRFGTIDLVETPYHLGRTLVHEVGHYFNLLHIHGDDEENCESDDLVEDTPFQTDNYFDCQEEIPLTCDSEDLTVNFMNWVSDDCMVMFTKGQVARMEAALRMARPELLDPLISTSGPSIQPSPIIEIFPNPVVSQQMFVHFSQLHQPVDFKIIDARGMEVQKGTFLKNQNQVSLQQLTKGIYWLISHTQKGTITKKLVLL